MDDMMSPWFHNPLSPAAPMALVKVTKRKLLKAIEDTLMQLTRKDLEPVLAEELALPVPVHLDDFDPADPYLTKRDLIDSYIDRYEVPALVTLGRRLVDELDQPTDLIEPYLVAYDRGGGVDSPAKNLIFAAVGPKPDLVLADAVSNTIDIVDGADRVLIYERPLPIGGLHMSHLVDWWRHRHQHGTDVDDRDVALDLHRRLKASLNGNGAEEKVLTAYAARYRKFGFDIPALIPQVYLHYDPHSVAWRHRTTGQKLARQRMDFLLLFSDRHRVVIEVDGMQHYADADGRASSRRYADLVAEDRRLRLAGYEVYRFGGTELARPDTDQTLSAFFDELAARMTP